MMSVCPDEETLFLSIDGELDAQSQLDLLRHLSVCESCRRRVAEMTTLTSGLSDALEQGAPGDVLSASEFAAMEKHVLNALNASGSVVPARRPSLGERALRLGGSLAKGTGRAVSAVFKGAGMVAGAAVKAAPAAGALASGGVRALKAAGKDRKSVV